MGYTTTTVQHSLTDKGTELMLYLQGRMVLDEFGEQGQGAPLIVTEGRAGTRL
jgi:hypothetical protein